MKGGYYHGRLPEGGRVTFVVADNGRSIQRGMVFTGLRMRCKGGVSITLFNHVLERAPMRIRHSAFRYEENEQGVVTNVSGHFGAGKALHGTVRARLANKPSCKTGAVRFTAHP